MATQIDIRKRTADRVQASGRMTKRPYAPGRTHGHATQYVIDYLRTHGEATARQIAQDSKKPRATCNISTILHRYPELFEEIGEAADRRTVWRLVEQ